MYVTLQYLVYDTQIFSCRVFWVVCCCCCYYGCCCCCCCLFFSFHLSHASCTLQLHRLNPKYECDSDFLLERDFAKNSRPYVVIQRDKHNDMCLPFVTVLRMLCVRVPCVRVVRACICVFCFHSFIVVDFFSRSLSFSFLLRFFFFLYFIFNSLECLSYVFFLRSFIRPLSIVFVSSCVNMLEPRKRSSLRKEKYITVEW